MFRNKRNTKLHIFALILTLFDLYIYALYYLLKSLLFPTNTVQKSKSVRRTHIINFISKSSRKSTNSKTYNNIVKNCLFLGQPLMYPTDKESSNLCRSRFDRNVLDRENILKHSKILQQSNHLVKNIFLRNSVYQCIVENLDLP